MKHLSIFFLLVSCLYAGTVDVMAQTTDRIVVPLNLSTETDDVDGPCRLTIRWYDGAIGGTFVDEEFLDVNVLHGRVDVVLAVSDDVRRLLRDGMAWIGVSINMGPERQPRLRIVSAPAALLAERSRFADRLSPDVTGLVTSLNEVAGAVKIIGEDGIDIRRDDDALIISRSARAKQHRGSVAGDGTTSLFTITLPLPISAASLFHVVVQSGSTTIACSIESVDDNGRQIHVRTAAPLLTSESLEWTLIP